MPDVQPPHDRRSEVLDAEARWAAAHRHLDLEALASTLDDDFRRIESDGSVSRKGEVLAWYADRHRHWEIAESDELDVRLVGDVAVVVGRWRGKGGNDDGGFDYSARYLSVWADRGGHWKMVGELSTEITGATPGEERD